MSTHNICFCQVVRKRLCGYPLLSGAINIYVYIITTVVRANALYQVEFSEITQS